MALRNRELHATNDDDDDSRTSRTNQQREHVVCRSVRVSQ